MTEIGHASTEFPDFRTLIHQTKHHYCFIIVFKGKFHVFVGQHLSPDGSLLSSDKDVYVKLGL